MRVTNSITNVCLLLYGVLLMAGCDQTFEPIKESDTVPLSMYGYLDASVDTQWVRVTPIRNQLNQSLEKPEMDVTLEEIQSGDTVVMSDSLFQLREDFNVINAWTTMDIEPGQTYQIYAERADGASSSVIVSLPEDFPTPVIFDYGDGCRGLLRTEGIEELADVQSIWHVIVRYIVNGSIAFEEERVYRIPHRQRANRIADGAYEVYLSTERDLEYIMNQLIDSGSGASIEIISRDIFVASGGPEWDKEIISLDDILYALPEGLSNIENGLGYMFGIVSKTIPYESCFQN